ncbi:hypothetical protein ES702_00409 [subsurface metagenome]
MTCRNPAEVVLGTRIYDRQKYASGLPDFENIHTLIRSSSSSSTQELTLICAHDENTSEWRKYRIVNLIAKTLHL